MESSISQTVYDVGQKIATSTGDLASELNQALNQLLGWPFRARTGFAQDADGRKTEVFGTLIYTESEVQSAQETLALDADNLACVIDVIDNLSIEKLRSAYERISQAKTLKKAPAPKIAEVSVTTITLGIIISRECSVPMESLAEELDHLNREHQDREWVDMIVVLSKGTINYVVQFPGEGLSGDFLPPAAGSSSTKPPPPIYVIIVIKPTGMFSFNKMFSFLLAHLMIFSPGAKNPNWHEALEGVTKKGLVITGYQYDLSGSLKPVPEKFYNDRYFPEPPFQIEDRKGEILSTLQFLPWQDGGVILLVGKLPLDGLLVFLGKRAIKDSRIINLDKVKISYVLPIRQNHFIQMLKRINRQSNLVVKKNPTKFIMLNVSDEGTSSPFVARLHLGILRLRDAVFSGPTERNNFDKHYRFVIDAMVNARSLVNNIIKLTEDHFGDIAKGNIVDVRGNTIRIKETIDKELRKDFESFLNSAVRVIKYGMQNLTEALQANIGFMFKKQQTFEKGIAELEKTEPLLAAYLREARKWSGELIHLRNDIEHSGWVLPGLTYKEVSGKIHAEEPELSGQTLSEFVQFMLDRLACFVEEVTTYCLQAKMPEGISITEIPLSQRESINPQRFRVTITHGGEAIWNIRYHENSFLMT
jgi:hypothetical protein